MALLGNGSVIHKSPGRFLNGYGTAGGGIASMRGAFNKHGMMRNAYEQFDDTAAIPYGYYGGQGAWVQPRTAGAVSGVNAIAVNLGASGAGSMGVAAIGSSTITFTLVGTGGLISSAAGTAAFTLDASGNIFASKATSGTAGITLAGSGALFASGSLGGSAGVTFAASWSPYAVGWLSGSTADSTVLTVDAIAAGVLAAALTTPIHADVRKVNAATVTGDGQPGTEWGPA